MLTTAVFRQCPIWRCRVSHHKHCRCPPSCKLPIPTDFSTLLSHSVLLLSRSHDYWQPSRELEFRCGAPNLCSLHFPTLLLAEDSMQKALNKWADWYLDLPWKWLNFQEVTLSLKIDGHLNAGAVWKGRQSRGPCDLRCQQSRAPRTQECLQILVLRLWYIIREKAANFPWGAILSHYSPVTG